VRLGTIVHELSKHEPRESSGRPPRPAHRFCLPSKRSVHCLRMLTRMTRRYRFILDIAIRTRLALGALSRSAKIQNGESLARIPRGRIDNCASRFKDEPLMRLSRCAASARFSSKNSSRSRRSRVETLVCRPLESVDPRNEDANRRCKSTLGFIAASLFFASQSFLSAADRINNESIDNLSRANRVYRLSLPMT